MEDITIETVDYILNYFSKLLTEAEAKAVRHHGSTIKLEGEDNEALKRIYLRKGWLTEDPNILALLEDGYTTFKFRSAQRIIAETPDQVFFNLCPICKKLARTPQAKQCRWCGHDWH